MNTGADMAIRYIITTIDKGTQAVVASTASVTKSVREATVALEEQTAAETQAAAAAAKQATATKGVTAASDTATAAAGRATAATRIQTTASEGAAAAALSANSALKKEAEATTAVGSAFAATGAKMTGAASKLKSLTLPLAAIAVVSGKSAMDFQRAMTMIETEAGAPRGEVAKLSQQVLDLAKTTAQGPNELAAGLYHLESIGLRGAKAMEALKLSAQGASISGADLEETTSALGSAWLVNIKGAGSLAHSMALMNAAAGAGNMRLGDLVHALGTGLLPASKEAGLGIKDALAALAVFTDEGYQASSAAAQMSTALHFLYNPTDKASSALSALGLNSDQLAKDMHKPQGLLVALTDLKKHLEEGGAAGAKFKTIKLPDGTEKLVAKNRAAVAQEQMLGDILPGGRGRILLTLLNQLDRYQMKIDQVGHTTSHFSEGVAKTQETAAFKVHNAWSKIQADSVELGGHVLPILVPAFADVADVITKVADGFGKLNPGTQKAIVYSGLFVAALGPVLAIGGRFLTSIGFLVDALKTLQTKLYETAAAEDVLAASAANTARVTATAAATTEAVVVAPSVLPAGMGAYRKNLAGAEGGMGAYRESLQAVERTPLPAPVVVPGIFARARMAVTGFSARGALARAGVVARGAAGRGLGAIPLAGGIYLGSQAAAQVIPHHSPGGKTASGLVSNVGSGAAAGAVLGSVVPVLGTAAGAAIGAALGGALSVVKDKNLRKILTSALSDTGAWIADNLSPITDALSGPWEATSDWVATASKNVQKAVAVVLRPVSAAVGVYLKPVGAAFKVAFAVASTYVRTGFQVVSVAFRVGFVVVTTYIKTQLKVVAFAFKIGFDVVSALLRVWWTVTRAIFLVGFAILVEVVKAQIAIFGAIWKQIVNVFGGPAKIAVAFVKAAFGVLKDVVLWGINAAVSLATGAWSAITSIWEGPLTDSWHFISHTVSSWAGKLASIGKSIADAFVGAFGGIGKAIGNAFKSGWDFVSDIGGGLAKWLNDKTILGDTVKVGPLHLKIPALAGGGMMGEGSLAAVSPGERVYMPDGGQWTVPGSPTAADSVITSLPAGAAVLTWSGQSMVDGGASLSDALAHQMPHFASGGVMPPPSTGPNVFETPISNPVSGILHKPAPARKKKSGIPKGYHTVDPGDVTTERGKGEKGGKDAVHAAAWAGRYLATSYGPPWADGNGTGVTASGINLKAHPQQYIVAADTSVIPMHSKLRINPNPFDVENLVFSVEDTGGKIKGKHIDIYDWRGRTAQTKWGSRQVSVHSAGSSSRSTKQILGPKVADLAPLTAAQARANLGDLLKPNVATPFTSGYTLGAAGLNDSIKSSAILQDVIKASRAPLKQTHRTVSVASGAGTADQGASATHPIVSGSWNPGKKPIASWIIPYLKWAAKNGWSGKVASGWRSFAEQKRIWDSGVRPAAKPGFSNHEGDKFPRGAVDVSGAAQLSALLAKRPGAHNLSWAGAKDPVHFSHPHGGSYRRGGIVGRLPRFRTGGLMRSRPSFASGGVVSPAVSLTSSASALTSIGTKDRAGLKAALTQFADDLDITVAAVIGRARAQIAGLRRGGVTKAESGQIAQLKAELKLLGKLPSDAAAVTYHGLEQTANAIQDQIRDLAKGGATKRERVQIKALEGALALTEAEMGRRVGAIVAGVDQMTAKIAADTTRTDQVLRMVDIDQASEQGQNALAALSKANLTVMQKQVSDLKVARDRALKAGDKATAKEIDSKLVDIQNTASETAVQAVEQSRAAIVAGSQSISDNANKAVAAAATGLNRSQRMAGVDANSGVGQRQTAASLQDQQGILGGAATGLQQQLAKMSKLPGGGTGVAAKAVQDQLDAINDQIQENIVQIAEANRNAIVADAQSVADHVSDTVARSQTAFTQSLSLSGVDQATSAGQKALKEYLDGQQGVLQQGVTDLQAKLADLQRAGGGADQQKQITDAIQGLNDQIAQNVVDRVNAARQQVLAGAQEAVDSASHGSTMSDQGMQLLEIQQKASGQYDTQAAAVARQQYIQQNTVPALEQGLTALQAQAQAIQQQTPNDTVSLRKVMEDIGSQQIAIAQAQLDAQEETAQNTADMLKQYGGTTTFDFGGQQYTDFSQIGPGL